MFGHFFFWLLKAKVGVFTVFTAAKIPLIATLLVLGTTGFVVTGTIQGDDDDRTVNLTIHPLESKTCIDALIAQTEALLEVDMLAADAKAQLRHMRDRARDSADEQNKIIDETALRAQVETSSDRVLDELSAASMRMPRRHVSGTRIGPMFSRWSSTDGAGTSSKTRCGRGGASLERTNRIRFGCDKRPAISASRVNAARDRSSKTLCGRRSFAATLLESPRSHASKTSYRSPPPSSRMTTRSAVISSFRLKPQLSGALSVFSTRPVSPTDGGFRYTRSY